MKVTYYAIDGVSYAVAAVVGDRFFHFDEDRWSVSGYSSAHWFSLKNSREVSKKYVILKGQYLLTEQEYKENLTKNPFPVNV